MGKIGDCTRLYSGKVLKERARMWVRLHRRMADYLQQAPVIVIADDSPDYRLALHRLCEAGAKLRDVLGAVGINVGLRHLHPHALTPFDWPIISSIGGANPSALAQQLAKRNPKQQADYLQKLTVYTRAYSRGQDSGVPLEWMVENLPTGDHDMRHYADIPATALEEHCFRSNARWRDFKAVLKKWEDSFTAPDIGGHMADALVYAQRTYFNADRQQVEFSNVEPSDLYAPAARINIAHEYQQRLIREIERRCFMGLDTAVPGSDRTTTVYWGGRGGRTLTPEAMRQHLEDRTKPLTPHKSAVLEDSSGPYTFRLLNTEAELHDEGANMRHCVGGYGPKVKGGHSLIYSIAMDGKRIATMELASAGYDSTRQDRSPEHRGWRFEQIKGVANAKVDGAIETIARAFAAKHFKIVEAAIMDGDWERFRWTERVAMRMVRPSSIMNYAVDVV